VAQCFRQRAGGVGRELPARPPVGFGGDVVDYDGSPYASSGDRVVELAMRGIRLVICCRSGQFPK
jgi:hypothetical protein